MISNSVFRADTKEQVSQYLTSFLQSPGFQNTSGSIADAGTPHDANT